MKKGNSSSSSTIKLSDYKTLQQQWLTTQIKFVYHDIQVFSKKILMKTHNIFISKIFFMIFQLLPINNTDILSFYTKLKEKSKGLITVYLKHNKIYFKKNILIKTNKYSL